MNSTANSILKTLIYSDGFNFPLTKSELYDRLITGRPVTKRLFITTLDQMTANGQVRKMGSYFYLPDKANTVAHRSSRLHESLSKLEIAKKTAQKLIKLPYVAGVFLTGALAVKNASADDDIDVLIVTKPQSLWTTRMAVTLWMEIHNIRRRPNQTIAPNKICANMYLDATNLVIPDKYRNLYTAFEVMQVKPLADPWDLHRQFLLKNRWIITCLANTRLPQPIRINHRLRLSRPAPRWLEKSTYAFQEWYMRSKRTREHVTEDQAFFHPRDLASLTYSNYNKRVESYFNDHK